MQINVDTRGAVAFCVGRPEPRYVDGDVGSGEIRKDRVTREPLYRLAVVLIPKDGPGQLIQVTVPGEPDVPLSAPVRFDGLRVVPWEQNGRQGNAWRPDAVEAVGGPVVDATGKPTVPLPGRSGKPAPPAGGEPGPPGQPG